MPDVSKIEIIGAQDEVIFVEFSIRASWPSSGIDRAALLAALQAQNVGPPRRHRSQTGDENISLRVSGAFESEQDILDVNFVAGGRLIRLGDIATGPARLSPIRRSRCSASTASRRSASASPCATAATSWRSASNIRTRDGDDHRRPAARHRAASWSPTSRSRSTHAIGEFMTSLWQAIAIILAVSFISLGVRPGSVVALSIPLTLAIVLPDHGGRRHRPAARSRWAR